MNRAVLAAAAVFLAVYLVDAWTSPITWWDGLASWGKWAADWGRRTSSAHYVTGAYPQLVPRLASVMYKIAGAHSDILPLDFFALHGFYVLFAAWFVLAAVRLSQLLEAPAWPVVLAGLGSMQFREHTGAGTVDVLVTATIVTLLALYLGLRRSDWSARRDHRWAPRRSRRSSPSGPARSVSPSQSCCIAPRRPRWCITPRRPRPAPTRGTRRSSGAPSAAGSSSPQ